MAIGGREGTGNSMATAWRVVATHASEPSGKRQAAQKDIRA